MKSQRGTTLFELLVVISISGMLAGMAIPTAAGVHRHLASATGSRELALVLRSAQARAQGRGTLVSVEIAGNGSYTVFERDVLGGEQQARPLSAGELGTRVASTYPQGVVAFGSRGWPRLPESTSPRAGSFTFAAGQRVVLQLGGCIRCL